MLYNLPESDGQQTMRTHLILAICATTIAAPGFAQAQTPVSFYREVRPILRKRCQGCHQPANQGGKLVLTNYSAFKAGGAGGVSFVPGKPQDSILMRFITGDPPAMPKNQRPLPKSEVEVIRRWIAEGAKNDTPVIKDPIDQDHPPTYSTPPVVSALAYSPDGSQLAVSGFREVLIHKADGSGLAARLVGKSKRIESVVYSPDGQYLAAVGGNPGESGEVQFWDAKTYKLANAVQIGFDSLFGASFSPDGKHLAFGGADNTVRVVSVPEGKVELSFGNHSDWIFATAWTIDTAKYGNAGKPGETTNRVGVFEKEQHLLSTGRDKAIKLIVSKTGHFVDDINTFTSGYRAMQRHPKSDEVLVGGDDGAPRRYQVFRTKPRTMNQEDHNLLKEYEKLAGPIDAVAFNPDGSKFAVGGEGGEVRIYETDSGKRVATINAGQNVVFRLAFRPDGKELAVGGLDGMIRLHDPISGSLKKEFSAAPISDKAAQNGAKDVRGKAASAEH
jgi:WD40 repeat protein